VVRVRAGAPTVADVAGALVAVVGAARTRGLEAAGRRAAVARLDVAVVARFTRRDDAVAARRDRAVGVAAVAGNQVPVVALLARADAPVAADGAAVRAAVLVVAIAVVALLAEIEHPVAAQRVGAERRVEAGDGLAGHELFAARIRAARRQLVLVRPA